MELSASGSLWVTAWSLTRGARTSHLFSSLGQPDDCSWKCDLPISIVFFQEDLDFRAGSQLLSSSIPREEVWPQLWFSKCDFEGWNSQVFVSSECCLINSRYKIPSLLAQISGCLSQDVGAVLWTHNYPEQKERSRNLGRRKQVRDGRRKRMAEQQEVPGSVVQIVSLKQEGDWFLC